MPVPVLSNPVSDRHLSFGIRMVRRRCWRISPRNPAWRKGGPRGGKGSGKTTLSSSSPSYDPTRAVSGLMKRRCSRSRRLHFGARSVSSFRLHALRNGPRAKHLARNIRGLSIRRSWRRPRPNGVHDTIAGLPNDIRLTRQRFDGELNDMGNCEDSDRPRFHARQPDRYSGRAHQRLDAESEYEVFQNFYELAQRRNCDSISHRLSTVAWPIALRSRSRAHR